MQQKNRLRGAKQHPSQHHPWRNHYPRTTRSEHHFTAFRNRPTRKMGTYHTKFPYQPTNTNCIVKILTTQTKCKNHVREIDFVPLPYWHPTDCKYILEYKQNKMILRTLSHRTNTFNSHHPTTWSRNHQSLQSTPSKQPKPSSSPRTHRPNQQQHRRQCHRQ